MNEQQEFLLNLLMEFDGICQKHGIDYVLCGGCAIGLERNKGFLPWDDDIDLFITRENLNKLDTVLKEELPEGRIWITEDNNPQYQNPLPRYMDANTTLVIRSWMDTGIPLAFMLELFVLDPYPNDPALQQDFNKYLWLYCELQADRYVISSWSLGKDTINADLYRTYKKRIEREGKEAVLAEIKREHLTYDYDECDYLCGFWGLDHKVVHKKWAEDIVRRDFEGKSLPFFRENIQYAFETEYGVNWNMVPVETKQVTHDNIVRIDEPYTEHIDEITDIARKHRMGQLLEENKKDNIERFFAQLDMHEFAAKQKRDVLQAMANELERQTWHFDVERVNDLYESFRDYFYIQFAQRYRKFHEKPALRDDVLETMLLTLLHRNLLTNSGVLVDLYPESRCYSEFRGIIDDICALKNAKIAQDADTVGNLLGRLSGKYCLEQQLEVERARMWLTVQTAQDMGDEEIDALIETCVHGSDYEIMKRIGDLHYEKGDYVAASKWYAPALKCRDGIILLDLNEKGFYC
ncbi:MAG: LicD family protein [Eggerthellaceae bacterium]|nr:LicD family protein [Eggerthellaceae bacterium]